MWSTEKYCKKTCKQAVNNLVRQQKKIYKQGNNVGKEWSFDKRFTGKFVENSWNRTSMVNNNGSMFWWYDVMYITIPNSSLATALLYLLRFLFSKLFTISVFTQTISFTKCFLSKHLSKKIKIKKLWWEISFKRKLNWRFLPELIASTREFLSSS